MTPDRLGRYELIATWQIKLQELSRQGECTSHLEQFLRRINEIPGDEVGEIGNQWRRRQKSQRPGWIVALLVVAWALCTLGNPWLGAVPVSLLLSLLAVSGAYALYRHWNEEEAFDRELYMRATYITDRPVWAR
jgi:hypothetical protein